MTIGYQFPLIRHIDDVLPHIDDKSFRVVEKDYGIFINYNMQGDNVFPAVPEYIPASMIAGSVSEYVKSHQSAAIRRECRGIMFHPKTGEIMSRPFHKFFNAGEREDVSIDKLDLSQPHKVYEKLDGSMIRPIMTDTGIRLGTKMGITDVALLAEEFVAGKRNYEIFMRDMVHGAWTPIFEFVSRRARIVVDYPEDNMILLAVRNNVTGEYRSDLKALAEDYDIPLVQTVASSDNMASLVETIRKQDTGEGVVVCWGGHKVKVKSEDYVRLHKAKDKLRTERNLVDLILSEGLDDLLPMLLGEDRDRVVAYANRFYDELGQLADTMDIVYEEARKEHDSKKDFAINSPLLQSDPMRSVVFALWDGKVADGLEAAHRVIRSGLVSETKWQAMKRQWIFETEWNEGFEE